MKATQLQDVLAAGLILVGEVDDQVGKPFAYQEALHRVLRLRQSPAVAVRQLEPVMIGSGRLAKLIELAASVHHQRGRVGPDDPVVLLDQDHAFGQVRNDAVQMRTFRRRRRNSWSGAGPGPGHALVAPHAAAGARLQLPQVGPPSR